MSLAAIILCAVAYFALAFLAFCIFASGRGDPMEQARDDHAYRNSLAASDEQDRAVALTEFFPLHDRKF